MDLCALHPRRRRAVLRLAAGAALSALACSSTPPQLLTLRDLEVGVNETVSFDVAATDADSSQLVFSFKPVVKGAQLQQIEGKLARFTWTPNPAQAGVTTFTFIADDGSAQDTETINIKVSSGDTPELVSPDRYVVDPKQTSTVKFVLEFRDAESTALTFAFDPDPTTWGAQVQTEGKKIFFSWEPTPEQQRVAQHSFTVGASDEEGHTGEKTITVIFRGAHSDCAANLALPDVAVDEMPNQAGDRPYAVGGTISDRDTAIQFALVYWTTVAEPTDNDWQNARLDEGAGNRWTGTIPNLQLGPGESSQVSFMLCAADDDDPTGDTCDGWKCSETHVFTASAGLGLCDPCDTGQCARGICLRNARNETFCGSDCAGAACPTGFYCADVPTSSGATSKQCIPEGCRGGASDQGCSCAAGRPSAPQAGDLVINEVLYDPPSTCPDGQTTCDASAKLAVDVNGDGVRKRDESDEEFVELLNVSTTKYLQLAGVTIADGKQVRFTFPTLVVPPGRAAVVFGGGDPAKFGSIGGAFKFSAAGTGAGSLSLDNGGDAVTVALGATQLDKVTWSGSVANQAIVRQQEGKPAAAMVAHASAPNASGVKYSPGTHTCGTPFPLDAEACVPPACAVTNRDAEPQSDQRPTAPCLKPLPQTVTSTLRLDPADPQAAGTDARDLYVVEGTAGQWLHARTAAGTPPGIGDTVLRLLARNGTQVDVNDDDPWNAASFYSRLITQLPSTGIYFLEVMPFARTGIAQGSYALTVELSATQPQKPPP